MIFAVEIHKRGLLVHVFADTNELTKTLEWQDVYGGAYTIVSDSGATFVWDVSKGQEEFGTIYGYTLCATGQDVDLAKRCVEQYQKSTLNEFYLARTK